MGAYEFNRSVYKPVTIRLNRIKDSDIIRYLSEKKSVNSYIKEVIRAEMASTTHNPLFEVIEDRGTAKDVLKGFNTLDDAIQFMYMYVSQFAPDGRVYIVQRFTGIQTDGHKVNCAKVLNIEKEENK